MSIRKYLRRRARTNMKAEGFEKLNKKSHDEFYENGKKETVRGSKFAKYWRKYI